jgi:hypothetical protein
VSSNNPSQPIPKSLDIAVPVPVKAKAAATPATPTGQPSTDHMPAPGRPWFRRPLLLASVAAGIVVLSGVGFMAMKLTHKSSPVAAHTTVSPTPSPSPTPAVNYSPLTGVDVGTADAANQPVASVMIENLYPDARPQSGLGGAGIVYEALAEGGITRFLGIFQEPFPGLLGPVRSLRPYYLDWGLEMGIPVAHAGGSEPALNAIKPLGLKNIDALAYDGSSFYRTSDRAAPHNLYTNSDRLSKLVANLGFATAPSFKPQPRKADAPPQAATHPNININFSTYYYAVKYTYDAASNAYMRFMGGAPHMDRNTNQQIKVKNIVVEFIPVTYGTQPVDGKPETDYHMIGSGKALIFEDGGVAAATWSKADDHAPTTLTDADGKPVNFNRGNTWFEAVPTGTAVTY